MIYPDLERELHEDRTAEIEHANRATLAARALVARVVQANWERKHANYSAGAQARVGARRKWPECVAGREKAMRKRGRPKEPKPVAQKRSPAEDHWGAGLLNYVRRDSDEQREAWRNG